MGVCVDGRRPEINLCCVLHAHKMRALSTRIVGHRSGHTLHVLPSPMRILNVRDNDTAYVITVYVEVLVDPGLEICGSDAQCEIEATMMHSCQQRHRGGSTEMSANVVETQTFWLIVTICVQ